MVNYVKYFVPVFLGIYGLTGLIIAGESGDEYANSDCSHSLSNYVTGSSLLYFVGGLSFIIVMIYADYHERIFDVFDILSEHYFINLICLFGTAVFVMWGSLALILSTCISSSSLFHIGTGLVIMQICSIIFQICFFNKEIIEGVKEITSCNVKITNPMKKDPSNKNVASYLSQTISV